MKIFNCNIYKSSLKTDAYLFILQQQKLESLPPELLKTLGKLEHVMDLPISEQSKLAQNNSQSVIQSLIAQGYYLQLPVTGAT